jgi:hypothetical protein
MDLKTLKKKIENISSYIKCVRASEGHDPIMVGITPGSPTLHQMAVKSVFL